MHKRLVGSGAEDRLSESQFGFRSGRFTLDAIYVLRRRIDTAWAQRHGHSMIMALDWSKAFDSIDPDAMMAALTRFGLPAHIIGVVRSIYTNRRFQVQDCDHTSGERKQSAGISQGCPLSPFLFVMLMTVLMSDATAKLTSADHQLLQQGRLAELLYADDTLLLSVSADSLERFLTAVSIAGASYGMELHWGSCS